MLSIISLYFLHDALVAHKFIQKSESPLVDYALTTAVWLCAVVALFGTWVVIEALLFTPFTLVREAQHALPIPVPRQQWLAKKLAVPLDAECPHFGIGSAGDERSEMIRYGLTHALQGAGWVRTPPGPTSITTDREAAHINVPAEKGVDVYVYLPPSPSKELTARAAVLVGFLRREGITAKIDNHAMMKKASAAEHMEINIGARAKFP
jgi:hypothetical protein